MTGSKDRRPQIMTVLRKYARDGTWLTCDHVEVLGEKLIDDETWGGRKVHSTLPAMHEDSYAGIIRQGVPTAASASARYEYMLADERGDLEEVKDSNNDLVSTISKLEQIGAYYDAVTIDGDKRHAGDTIESDGEVIHRGHGGGGKAVTGRELAKATGSTTEDAVDRAQKSLSKLCQRGWLDRRKRIDEPGNPFEYWLNPIGFESIDEFSTTNPLEQEW